MTTILVPVKDDRWEPELCCGEFVIVDNREVQRIRAIQRYLTLSNIHSCAVSLAVLLYAKCQSWNSLSSFTCGSFGKDQLAASPEWQGPKETP